MFLATYRGGGEFVAASLRRSTFGTLAREFSTICRPTESKHGDVIIVPGVRDR